MGSLISAMVAISTPLILLILPILASAVQEDPQALQWEQGNHGGPHGSETWYWRALIDNPFPNRFGKITKRDMLKKKDKDEQSLAEKMILDELLMDEEGQRIEDETIRMLQEFLTRGRKYSRFV